MPVSVTELREQARLLEAELTRQATLSDSIDTRAGVTIGFAGAIAGVLVLVKNPSAMVHRAVVVALASAIIGALASFPRRMKFPDPELMASYYRQLPEHVATEFLCQARIKAINDNNRITDAKRVLLAAAVFVLVAAIVLSVLAVRGGVF